jgi:hypothetical protein
MQETCLLENPFPHVALTPVLWKDKNIEHKAEGYRAVIDKNTGKLFSVVSKHYRLIRHEEAIEEVEKAIGNHRNLGRSYIASTEFYNDGARMRRTYRFPNITVKIAQNDVVDLELHLFNSYDKIWPFIVILGGYRLVCSNGLVVGETYYNYRRRHVFDLADLSASINKFRTQAKKWTQWTEIPLTEKVFHEVIKSMKLGKNAVLEIQHQAAQQRVSNSERGIPLVSLWVFYNLITWYISFRTVSLNHRVEMENRLRSSMKYFRYGSKTVEGRVVD